MAWSYDPRLSTSCQIDSHSQNRGQRHYFRLFNGKDFLHKTTVRSTVYLQALHQKKKKIFRTWQTCVIWLLTGKKIPARWECEIIGILSGILLEKNLLSTAITWSPFFPQHHNDNKNLSLGMIARSSVFFWLPTGQNLTHGASMRWPAFRLSSLNASLLPISQTYGRRILSFILERSIKIIDN